MEDNNNATFVQQPIMQQPVQQQPVQQPIVQLKTNRSLGIVILLSIITFGIYLIVLFCKLSTEINVVASRADGKHTPHYIVSILLSFITFGIYGLVWSHKYSERVGLEAARRNTGIQFGAADFWIWSILLTIIFVGPFIYLYKLLQATNAINTSYNMYG